MQCSLNNVSDSINISINNIILYVLSNRINSKQPRDFFLHYIFHLKIIHTPKNKSCQN